MQLLSKSHYLVWVPGDVIKKASKRLGTCDGVWVGFNDHGDMVGHTPYQQDDALREIIFKLAKDKMWRFPNG
jgi:hypothetical protein